MKRSYSLTVFFVCSAILGRAEKKIMNAASKLATMAKGLETPLRHVPQSKSTHSGMLGSIVVLLLIITDLRHAVMKMLMESEVLFIYKLVNGDVNIRCLF